MVASLHVEPGDLVKTGDLIATIKVQPDEAPPLALIKEWIDESYRAIAPKKLIKELDAGS